MPVGTRSVEVPAIPWASEWDRESYDPAPAVDEQGAAIRTEFAARTAPAAAFLVNPNRFKNKRPKLPKMPTAVWINPPTEEKRPSIEPVFTTLN